MKNMAKQWLNRGFFKSAMFKNFSFDLAFSKKYF